MQVKQLLAILSKKSCMEVVCVIQVATFFFSFVVQLLIVPTQSPLSGRRSTYNIRMCMKLDLVFKEGRFGLGFQRRKGGPGTDLLLEPKVVGSFRCVLGTRFRTGPQILTINNIIVHKCQQVFFF
jgi:hypothetical protein